MTLLENLPEEVELSLRNYDFTPSLDSAISELPRIAFATDINAKGDFAPEWLVAERGQIMVFAPNGDNKAQVVRAISLDDVREVRAEQKIGNGELVARTYEETVPLVRYSQASSAEANMVARQLNSMAKGETPRAENIDISKNVCDKCGRPLGNDTNVCPACLDRRATLVRLFRFLKPYRLQVAAGIVLIAGSTSADLMPPYIAGRLLNQMIFQTTGKHKASIAKAPQPVVTHPFHVNHSMTIILMWVALLAVSRILSAAFTYGQQRLNPWLGGHIIMDIRMALYTRLSELSLSYYDKRSTGSIMSRLTGDSDNLQDFITGGIPWFVTNMMTLIGIGVILFKLNWQLSLMMLIPAPFIFLLARWFMPRARKRFHVVWHRISKMYGTLGSTLAGMRVMKAFAQENREVDFFRSRNQAVFESSYNANAFRATFWPLLGLLMSVGSYIIWIAGGHDVIFGTMSIGVLMMFVGYLNQFYQPFMSLSQVMDWATRSMTAAERVFEVLDTEPEIVDAEDAIEIPCIEGAVTFDHVTFTYDNARQALDDFTLDVKPGEMIGLVGHSGAGKSTIISLLSRFYEPTNGSILVDGVNIKNIRHEDFRRQIGIVPQEPFLFPGTIKDNIAYARPTASIEEIVRAAKAANCHEFIMKFPDGYDTSVGERGQRLSGGERQRISIARAILHNPRILILDEATASVDTETEKQIQDAINRLIENRTTFAIAHRLSTLRHANRLVVMKDGKMAESGTHDELMELDGVYAGLVKVQSEVNQLRAI